MIFWCALALAQQPVALDDRLDLDVTPLADGFSRLGEPAGLTVSVTNLGPGTTATVTLSTVPEGWSSSRRVALPRGADKSVGLAVPTLPQGARELVVTLTTEDERELSEVTPLRLLTGDDVLIGVLGPGTLGLTGVDQTWTGHAPGHPGYTAEAPRQVRTVLLEPPWMPTSTEALTTLDVIVWDRPDPSDWSLEQLEALGNWVATGGTLVVLAPDGGARFADSPVADWLPARVGGVEEAPTWELSSLVRQKGSGRTPVAELSPRPDAARTQVSMHRLQDGRDAWVAGTYGLGPVHVVGFDPTAKPFDDRERRLLVWRTLLDLPPAEEGWAWQSAWVSRRAESVARLGLRTGRSQLAPLSPLHGSPLTTWRTTGITVEEPEARAGTPTRWEAISWRVSQALASLPPQDPFPWQALLAFFAAGGLWVGVGERVLLRLLRRPTWMLWTWPVSLVALSAMGWLGARHLLESAGSLDQVEVVDLLPGTRLWRGTTLARVHATHGDPITLRPRVHDAWIAPAWYSPGRDVTLLEDQATPSLVWKPEPWDTLRVEAHWVGRARGSIRVLPLSEGGWRIENDLPVDLSHGLLWVEAGYAKVPALTAGERIVVGPDELVLLDYDGPLEGAPTLQPEEPVRVLPADAWIQDSVGSRAASALAWHQELAGAHLDPEAWARSGGGVFFGLTTEPLAPLAAEGPSLLQHGRALVRVPFTEPR